MKTILLRLLPLVTLPAWAGSSSSANYAITTDVLDAGGQKTTSANYANDGSIGGLGRSATLGAYFVRGGFPGQLYDLTNALAVNLSPATIGEGVPRQLAVQAVADDTTRIDLAPASVSWSSTGPLSIAATGVATGGTVYQDTAATAIATQGSKTGQLNLSVLDTLTDNFGLYAADGLDDSWQIGYFGVNHPNGTGTADPDGDGQNNRLEFLAETVPVDSLSRLRLRIENVAGKPDWKALVFSPYSTKRTYAIEWTSEFDKWYPLEFFNVSDSNNERFIVDEEATDPKRVYRLRIEN